MDTPVDILLGDEFSRLIVPWMATKATSPTVTTDVRMSGRTKTAAVTIVPASLHLA